MYESSKIIIQSLFCVCDLYCVDIEGFDNIFTISDVIKSHRANKIVLNGLNENDINNITLCKNGEFIDLLPQNESEVDSLFNIMTFNRNDAEIIHRFENSHFDRMYDRGPDADQDILVFDRVSDPREFFHSLRKIGFANLN